MVAPGGENNPAPVKIKMTTPTFSVWTRDSLHGWNKGATLYYDRNEAAKDATAKAGKFIYQGGAYSTCTDIRVFPSAMTRSDVLAKVRLAA